MILHFAVRRGPVVSFQYIEVNIAFLLALLILRAGNIFLLLVDSRQIQQTRCSLHVEVPKSVI